MNYTILLVVFLATSVLANEPQFHEDIDEFEKEFHELDPPEEKAKKAEELAKAEEEINAENAAYDAGEASFAEKLNPDSDLPKEEFEKEKEGMLPPPPGEPSDEEADRWINGHYNGLIMPPLEETYDPENDREMEEFYGLLSDEEWDRALPASYNAVTKNLVTTPKNQGQCGSCAAFSAAAMHETCMIKAGAKLTGLDLSEQFLVDCGYNGGSMNACKGASPHAYQKWFATTAGGKSLHENKYPYLNKSPKLTCPSGIAKWNSGAIVKKANWDFACTESKLKKLVVKHGAVTTGIYASDNSFGNYAKGVYTGCTSTQCNHAVTVVGYGKEGGIKFWLVKNSWGTTWGLGGYFKIKRGVSECGIGGVCVMATCKKSGGSDSVPATTAAPGGTTSTCDLSGWFGPITGNFNLWTPNGTKKITCSSGVCKPAVATSTNACVYICGMNPCA